MPIMNGWEAVKKMRQLEEKSRLGKKIPIIAVTAFNSLKDQ